MVLYQSLNMNILYIIITSINKTMVCIDSRPIVTKYFWIWCHSQNHHQTLIRGETYFPSVFGGAAMAAIPRLPTAMNSGNIPSSAVSRWLINSLRLKTLLLMTLRCSAHTPTATTEVNTGTSPWWSAEELQFLYFWDHIKLSSWMSPFVDKHC